MRDSSCRPVAGTGLTVRYRSHRLQAVVFTPAFQINPEGDMVLEVRQVGAYAAITD